MNKSKIMIVESDSLVASETEQQMEKLGYDVSLIKYNGNQTVTQIIDNMPDLVLIGNDVNGIEIAKIIRLWHDIPVIYLSTNQDKRGLNKVLHTEPYGFLLKPYNELTLFAAIEIAINRNRSYKKLKENEARYHSITDAFDGYIYISDNEYNLVFANESVKIKAGKKINSEKCYKAIHGIDTPCSWCPMEQTLRGKLSKIERYDNKDDKWYEELYVPVFYKEGYIYNQTTFYDITERKNELEIQYETIKKYEVLIEEIHHRIKNNLQVISSFLNIQSTQIKDKDSIQILRESRSRVNSIILVHDKLYNTKQYSRIDFEDYLKKLTSHLIQLYSTEKLKINFTINAQNIILDVDTAIPAGLIINELVTNSLKHAFNHHINEGNIDISLKQNGKDEYYLRVTDNGIGIPEYIEASDKSSLGMQIISILTKQLAGEMKINVENGTEIFIKFKEAGHRAVIEEYQKT